MPHRRLTTPGRPQTATENPMTETTTNDQADATITIRLTATPRGIVASTNVEVVTALGDAVLSALGEAASISGERMAQIVGAGILDELHLLRHSPFVRGLPEQPRHGDPRVGRA